MTFAVCEIGHGEIIKVLKESNSLMELSKMDIDPGSFPAVFISRNVIRGALTEGFDPENLDEDVDERISRLTDEEMWQIASDLQDAYVDGNYWTDIECICEDLNNPELGD